MAEHADQHQQRSHHDYDGIQEEDNQLPRWWLATLFLAIAFSFFYWEYFHVLKVGPGITEEYALEAKAAEERAAKLEAANLDDATLLALLNTPAMEEGTKLYTENCAACHGAQGEGKIGPNLTDNFWLYGGSPLQIYKTVMDGQPIKGMPAWRPVLGPQKVKAVVAFLLSIRGKNVAGKAPEGKEMVMAAAAPAVDGGDAPDAQAWDAHVADPAADAGVTTPP